MWSRSWVIRARLVWGRRGASAASTIYTRDAVSSVIDTRPASRDTRGPPSRLCACGATSAKTALGGTPASRISGILERMVEAVHLFRRNAPPNCGYRGGIRQPGLPIALDVAPQVAAELELIDRRLQQSFDLTLEPRRVRNPDKLDPTTASCVELVWRILLLGRSLLQAVRAPVFDAGRVLDARPSVRSKDLITVQVVVPWLDHIAAHPLLHAYQAAIRVVTMLATQREDDTSVRTLMRNLHERFIKPTQGRMPGGESTVPALATAYQKDIPFRHLSAGVFMLGWGKKARLLDRSVVESDSAIGSKLCANKHSSASLLRSAGLPAPQHFLVRNEKEAIEAARKIGWPAVVKPLDRERGEGVVVDVRDEDTLRAAYAEAARLSPGVLVERQVAGVCHRVYVSYGKVLYATKRLPMLVTGDGIHTVAELIAKANADEQSKVPWRRPQPLPSDGEASRCLAEAGLKMDSVPAAGEKAFLRHVTTAALGGVTEDRTDTIHPHNREIAARAARLFRLDSAGIDIITPDIGVPWHANGAVIGEVNFAPLVGTQRTRYIAEIVATLVDGDGRIPVEVIVGKDSFDAAVGRQQAYLEDKTKCFVTNGRQTLSPAGEAFPLASTGLHARCRALLMHGELEALVIAVQTDEFLATGLPVDRIDRLIVLDDEVMDWRDRRQKAGSGSRQDLLDLLESYTVDAVQRVA